MSEEFTPLTEEEKDHYEWVRLLMGGLAEEFSPALMRVRLGDQEAVAVVAARVDREDGLVDTRPVAILVTGDIFEMLTPPPWSEVIS